MANPFLSMGDPPVPFAVEASNPFMTAEPIAADGFSGDNPFAGGNPFSDFSAPAEPAAGDVVPMDIFGAPEPPESAAPPPAKPTDLGLDEPRRPRRPPPPPARPLPPETRHLITTVTDQMDFASAHLLDRIPPTRTPSPVSARDLRTPSPSEEGPPRHAHPSRPPPARPQPPRPVPPAEELNLFDAPAPVTSKPTKEDILGLYAAPKKKEKQIDFLSDDIVDDVPAPVVDEVMKTEPDSELASMEAAEPPPSDAPKDVSMDFATTDSFNSAAEQSAENSPFSRPMVETSPFAQPVAAPFAQPVAAPFAQPVAAPFAQPVAAPFAQPVAAPFAVSPVESSHFIEPTAEIMPIADLPSETSSCADRGSETSPFADPPSKTSPFADAPSKTSPFADTPSKTSPFADAPSKMSPFADAPSKTSPFADAPSKMSPFADAPSKMSPFADAPSKTSPFADLSVETTPFADHRPSPFAISTISNEDHDDAAFGAAFGNPFGDVASTFELSAGESARSPFSNATLPEFSGDAAEPMALDSAFPEGEDAFAVGEDAFPVGEDAFDAFSAKFDSTFAARHRQTSDDGAWGGAAGALGAAAEGFEAEAFDSFLSMSAPPPCTPRLTAQTSQDSVDDTFSLFIRPIDNENGTAGAAPPALAPPPRVLPPPDTPPEEDAPLPRPAPPPPPARTPDAPRSGGDTPPTPLFDDDVSVPLEEFPRVKYDGDGWEMYLRQPNKKKITGQRFWKKVFVRLAQQGDNPVVQLRNQAGDKEPFQELPLQACYSVSEISAQQFDQFGKIFTAKLQYVFYKERPGVRPGQVRKAERITTKLTQFAAYAIQGDYQGVKEFGSDLRKLGLPVEHAPQVSQLFKLGSLSYEDVKQFSCCVEEALFRLPAHRDRALAYKTEEVQVTAVDELFAEQDSEGAVLRQVARVRVFFLGFLGGMPDIELGVNDLRRQGREVVGRHDIIPVVTEEWIRVENQEFHACVQPAEFYDTQIIKFKPPDACYIELMRFRVRPPKNRELPLQLKAAWCVTGNKVELRADVLVPGFASRSLGQVPCEDVSIRFPIPECWIYLFRVEKHFRYGSVKSAHRRTGKIKGIERFLGAVDTLQESLIEVTSGQAKYEHQHRAIVWRMPRLPKEGQGAYTTHNMVCRMALTSYDQVPAELARWAVVEFTMPATQVSHVTVRSVSLQQHDNDPPEKYVRYLARHEYRVGIERTTGQSAAAYVTAAAVPAAAPAPAPAPAPPPPASSDSDSD